jgi:hypothetical protein
MRFDKTVASKKIVIHSFPLFYPQLWISTFVPLTIPLRQSEIVRYLYRNRQ